MGFRVFMGVVDNAHELPIIVPQDIEGTKHDPHVYVEGAATDFKVILPADGKKPSGAALQRHRAVRAIAFLQKTKLKVQVHQQVPKAGTSAKDTIFVAWDPTRGLPKRVVKAGPKPNTLNVASRWVITAAQGNHVPAPSEGSDAASGVPQSTTEPSLAFETSRFDDDEFVISHVDGHSIFGHLILTVEESLLRDLDQDERSRLIVLTTDEGIGVDPDDIALAFAQSAPTTRQINADTKVRFSTSVDARLYSGLQHLSARLLEARVGPNPGDGLPIDRTGKFPLDLIPHGGQASLYQFTYVRRNKFHKKEKEVLVDHVGVSGVASPSQGVVQRGKSRATKFEIFVDTDAEVVDSIHEALAWVPDSIAVRVAKLNLSRVVEGTTNDEAGGDYQAETHTVRIFNKLLLAEMSQAMGGPNSLITTKALLILHEIGHALDAEVYGTALRQYNDAKREFTKEYRKYLTDGENFRVPPGDPIVPEFEADVSKVKALERAADPSNLYSAGRDFKSIMSKEKAISRYGTTNHEESYAEAFCCYVVDEPLLETLRPKTHAYFRANVPK